MKEQPQPATRRIIERPRLINQLEESDARTILLVAPAGTARRHCSTVGGREWLASCWYTAESGSSDLAQLSLGLGTALEASCSRSEADVSQVVTALSNPGANARNSFDAFRRRLAGTALETVVIDDYHLIAESSLAETFIHKLFSRADVRLLVGSRRAPLMGNRARRQYTGSC